jgi:hypothetical protein
VVLLALLGGPVGPAGVVHLALGDGLPAGGVAGARLDAQSSDEPLPGHAGASCPICQALQGLRCVLSVAPALPAAPPRGAVLPPAFTPFAPRNLGLTPSGRAPPTIG